MYKTNVVVKFQIEGLHHWPDARRDAPEVGFLADNHRHIFYITCKLPVDNNDNRDVEIIMLKRKILQRLKDVYFRPDFNCLNFGPQSCETIAKWILDTFRLSYCQVLEDNENGAEIWMR